MFVTSCAHELGRERVIRRGELVDRVAMVVLADEVHTEKSCAGDKLLFGVITALTFGIAYFIAEAGEAKSGRSRWSDCPRHETRYEREKRVATPLTVPNEARRFATDRPQPCRFDPDGDCTTGEWIPSGTIETPTARGWSSIERRGDGKFRITIADRRSARRAIDIVDEPWAKVGTPLAIAVTGDRVVVRSADRTCWLVTRATGAAVPFDDCDSARWLDAHTAWIANRLVDLDTSETYPARRALWLGKDLGFAERDGVVEVVRRGPWRVLATVTPVRVIDEPDQITIIGTTAIVSIRADGNVATHPIPIVPGRILDIRGDLALVTIAKQPLVAATIRLSTGEVVARTN